MGTYFPEMFTYAPYTVASLHALFTGLYGSSSGVNAYYASPLFKKDECYTLPQYLKDEGYMTKVDTINNILLPNQGIDDFSVYDEANVDIIERHSKIIKELSDSKKKFFLFLHHGLIHAAIVRDVIKKFSDFDKKYFGKIEKNARRYDRLVADACGYLKEMIKVIEKSGLFSNSLVIVLTDHGGGLGEKPGEKAYGIYTYDYSVKIWAYFINPKYFPKGLKVNQLVRNVDVMPTILDVLPVKPKKKYIPFDGKTLIPLVKGGSEEERIAFIETAGIDGPTPSPYKPNVKCIRTKEWKIIYNLTTKKRELYNLREDPTEDNNLAGSELEIEKILFEKLKPYLKNADIVEKPDERVHAELKKMGYAK